MWARKNGCPVETEALGTDYDEAVKHAERVLLPAFDAWRKRGEAPDKSLTLAKTGTLDWMFAD
jgi:hypothetical protein